MAFITGKTFDPRLETRPYCKESLDVVIPKNSKATSFDELLEMGFVDAPEAYARLARMLNANAPHLKASQFKKKAFINQINRIPDPVVEGLGFTVLHRLAWRRHARAKKLRTLKVSKDIQDTVYVATRRGEKLPSRYERFLKILQPFVYELLE
jgi:DNA-binding transcriptional LysR family regulator